MVADARAARAGAGSTARGYHPGDFTQPRTPRRKVRDHHGRDPHAEHGVDQRGGGAPSAAARRGSGCPPMCLPSRRRRLAGLIRSSGYFNQKAKKLKAIAALFSRPRALTPRRRPVAGGAALRSGASGRRRRTPSSCMPSTCPSSSWMPTRAGSSQRIGLIDGTESYDDIQGLFHGALEPRPRAVQRVPCPDRPACQGALPSAGRVVRRRVPCGPAGIATGTHGPILNRGRIFRHTGRLMTQSSARDIVVCGHLCLDIIPGFPAAADEP